MSTGDSKATGYMAGMLAIPSTIHQIENEYRKACPDRIDRKNMIRKTIKAIKDEVKDDELMQKELHIEDSVAGDMIRGINTLVDKTRLDGDLVRKSQFSMDALIGSLSKVMPNKEPTVIKEKEFVVKPRIRRTNKDKLIDLMLNSGFDKHIVDQLENLLTNKYSECVIIPISAIKLSTKLCRLVTDGGLESLRPKITTRVLDDVEHERLKLPKKRPKKQEDIKRLRPYKAIKMRFTQREDTLDKENHNLNMRTIQDDEYEIDSEEQYNQEEVIFNFDVLSKLSKSFLKNLVKFYVLDSFFNLRAKHETSVPKKAKRKEIQSVVGGQKTSTVINQNNTKRKLIELKMKSQRSNEKFMSHISNFRSTPFSFGVADFSRSSKRLWIDKYIGLGMQPEEEGEMKKLKAGRFQSR